MDGRQRTSRSRTESGVQADSSPPRLVPRSTCASPRWRRAHPRTALGDGQLASFWAERSGTPWIVAVGFSVAYAVTCGLGRACDVRADLEFVQQPRDVEHPVQSEFSGGADRANPVEQELENGGPVHADLDSSAVKCTQAAFVRLEQPSEVWSAVRRMTRASHRLRYRRVRLRGYGPRVEPRRIVIFVTSASSANWFDRSRR